MAGPSVVIEQQDCTSAVHSLSGNRFALISLTSLFFMWGFITCLNDILIPYLKGAFELNYTQAMLIQFCFFGAYFIVSIPAGKLIDKVGYQKGIVFGLSVASFGCLLFIPAAYVEVYALFLFALFVLASGIVILQVSANPYVTALGKPETASSRLTLTQAFNSLGTTLAPYFGAVLIYSASSEVETQASSSGVQIPYLILALTLLFLAVVFFKLKMPRLSIETSDRQSNLGSDSAWNHRHLVLGAIAIFVYVGAEVSIGSFLVNFLSQDDIAGLSEKEASKLITYYWGGAMVGRFIGAAVLQKVAAGKVLFFHSIGAIVLVSLAIVSKGSFAMWCILGVGLFNSIMFPTIFSLAINGLGKCTSQGSGILCLSIVGGAIIPLLQGMLADTINLQIAFILPAICYIYIAYYALWGSQSN
ncbi:MAG: sugar MFS transporter [Kangiellaceae bacterium]|nr:sugar MFS transporter [Kangiellaceae bacterium]